MKVYVYSDNYKRNLVYKTLKIALLRNPDLDWTIWVKPQGPTQCIAQAFYGGDQITICELEVFE